MAENGLALLTSNSLLVVSINSVAQIVSAVGKVACPSDLIIQTSAMVSSSPHISSSPLIRNIGLDFRCQPLIPIGDHPSTLLKAVFPSLFSLPSHAVRYQSSSLRMRTEQRSALYDVTAQRSLEAPLRMKPDAFSLPSLVGNQ